MIKVIALTEGRLSPASRFRIRQYIKPLADFGIRVEERMPLLEKDSPPWLTKRSRDYFTLISRMTWFGAKVLERIPAVIGSWGGDITWISRSLKTWRVTFEPFLKKPLVLDVDDAIWLPGFSQDPKMVKRAYRSTVTIARLADVVIAGNRYIAEWYKPYARDIRVVPTTVDTERYKPRDTRITVDKKDFVIGWTGSPENLQFLKAIESPIKDFLDKFFDSRLLIITSKEPSFKFISSDRIIYIPWSPKTEVEALQRMDVGLSPLADNEWTRAKCGFRMIQYMACGVPVIASPVGVNADILSQGKCGIAAANPSDWYEALVFLYKDKKSADEYGKNGRAIIEREYSQKVIVEKLADIFKDLASQ